MARRKRAPLAGVSQFDGMSSRERRGMPCLDEATLMKLGVVPAGRAIDISRSQEQYVRTVRDACPRWRPRKKRKLTLAARLATHVREINEHAAQQRERLGI